VIPSIQFHKNIPTPGSNTGHHNISSFFSHHMKFFFVLTPGEVFIRQKMSSKVSLDFMEGNNLICGASGILNVSFLLGSEIALSGPP
jgi:hypothetical protein